MKKIRKYLKALPLVVFFIILLFPLQAVAETAEKPGFFAKLIGEILSTFPDALANAFGLKSFPQLVFNKLTVMSGTDTSTVWGLFSAPVMNHVINPMRISLTAIAWTIVIGIIYVASIQLARGTVNNSGKRAKLYGLLENWVIGAILLGGNAIIVGTVFDLANGFIATIAPSSTIPDYLNFSFTATGIEQLIVSPLIMLAIFGLTLALNFIYLQRYFVMIVLTILAPLFCVCAISDNTRHIFSNWWKEIISNAAMPVTHAIFFWIYTAISALSTGPGAVTQLLFLILMIPMSDMIRGMLGAGGSGKGLSNTMLLGMGLGAAAGLAKSVFDLGQAVRSGEGPFGGVRGIRGNGGPSGGSGFSGVSAMDGGPAGYAQSMASNARFRGMEQNIASSRFVGGSYGRVMGGVAGAVMGAAMGNGAAATMGAYGGSIFGGHQGEAAGGRAAFATMEMQNKKAGYSEEDVYRDLGSSNLYQSQTDASGAPIYNADGSPLTKPVVDSQLSSVLGKANYDHLKAQAYAGGFGGRQAADNAAVSNSIADQRAAENMISPDALDIGVGDRFQKITTDQGSHIYQIKPNNAKQYVGSTSESDPRGINNPVITESEIVQNRDTGKLEEKMVRQGVYQNYATSRGAGQSSIFNNL